MQKITIAIDGYSSTGKSTVAKELANHLGYIYVDSGAMYRAVTLFAMQQQLIDATNFNIEGLVSKLYDVHLDFKYNEETENADIYLNGKNVEKEIRTLDVSNFVSPVAAVPEVRYQLVKQQQKLGAQKGVVMDGRDIGTVVFPNADLKIFMTASAATRAKRRFDELINRGDKVVYDDVLQNIQERDYIDSHRADSPLMIADDAIEIDNSHLSLDVQFQKIMELVTKTLEDLK